MHRHNYTQYANNKNPDANEIIDTVSFDNVYVAEEENTIVEPIVAIAEESVETAVSPKPIKGVVANCTRLNVRVAPNSKADVACVVEAKASVEIDTSKSTDDWYHVCTVAGIEGYCMKQYIDAEV